MSARIQKLLEQKAGWPEIKNISKLLSKKGFQTVVAGGAVRDALLGKTPKDIDLASSAKPEDILKIFPRAKMNFARYGISLIPLKTKEALEIAAFRKDSSYEDGRRPKSISFCSIEEDARRRDFTINALFYDPQKEELIDFVGGLKDLKNKVLRAVGPAKKRFEEDHLRALRALRLAHQLGFQIEEKTKKAIPLFARAIKGLAKERILDELSKMLSAGRMGTALKSLKERGFFYSVFPNLKGLAENRHLKNPFDFWDKKFSFSADPAFCWALLALPFFYNSAKGFKLFLKSLFVPSSAIKKALAYLKAAQNLTDQKASFAEKLKAFEGQKKQAFELARFWLESQGPSPGGAKPPKASLRELKSLFKEFEKRQKGGLLPSPLVRGGDLMDRFPLIPKQKLSSALKQAFEYQMESPRAGKAQILKRLQNRMGLKKQAPLTAIKQNAKKRD